jgi:predicted TIM-barrel fold metal-dependent hydrolase
MRIIDGDGHVIEDVQAIQQFLPASHRDYAGKFLSTLFPPLDHFHSAHLVRMPPEILNRGPVGYDGWMRFLDDLGIEQTIMYPTLGLGYGKMVSLDWMGVATRAYNDWITKTYLERSTRFQAVGLLPLRDPEAAVKELRRMVRELGMVGAMLPSTGLAYPLGAREYWPVYEEANRLGCCLGIHGGAHSGLGFDQMNIFSAIHAIGHPVGMMISFASMLFNGVFDRYPDMRVGFMEGGVAWIFTMLERCDGSYRSQPSADSAIALKAGETVRQHIIELIRAGRIFIGCEGDEPELAAAISVVGPGPFIFSSDFPHEVSTESCRAEIEELKENPAISAADKAAILAGNAERLYRRTG